MDVDIYVCPTAGCGNYYGSNGMPDLHEKLVGGRGLNLEPTPQRERPRSACPDCLARGDGVVLRERVTVAVDRPDGKTLFERTDGGVSTVTHTSEA